MSVRDGRMPSAEGPLGPARMMTPDADGQRRDSTTGGVTAPVVRTRRAKSGARATEPTIHTGALDNVNRKETKR